MDIPMDAWQRLLQSAVWPTVNTTVNAAQAEALARIQRGDRVPLAHLLYNNLCKVADDPQPKLCHPHLIRRLCQDGGVEMKDFPVDSGPEFPIWQLPKVNKGVTEQRELREAPGYPRPKSIKVARPKIPAGERDLKLTSTPPRAPSGPVIIDASALDAEPIRAEIGSAIERAVGTRFSGIEAWKEETEAWKKKQEDTTDKLKDAFGELVTQGKKRDDMLADLMQKGDAERRRQELRDAKFEKASELQMNILLSLAKRVEAMSSSSTTAGEAKVQEPIVEPPTQQRTRTPSGSGSQPQSMEGSSEFDTEMDLSPVVELQGEQVQEAADQAQSEEEEEEEDLSSGEEMEEAQSPSHSYWDAGFLSKKLPREGRITDPDYSPATESDSDEVELLDEGDGTRIKNVSVPDEDKTLLRIRMKEWKSYLAKGRKKPKRDRGRVEEPQPDDPTDGADEDLNRAEISVRLTHKTHSEHLCFESHDLTDTSEAHTTDTNVLSLQDKVQKSGETGPAVEQQEPPQVEEKESEQDRGIPSSDKTQQTGDSTFDLPSLDVNLSLGDSGNADSPRSPTM